AGALPSGPFEGRREPRDRHPRQPRDGRERPLMLPLLAEGNPFEHTWNTWLIEFYGHAIDLRDYEICRRLGISNAVVTMLFVALLLMVLGIRAGAEASRGSVEGRAPRGIAAVFEAGVLFIRDAMMKPNMPHHWRSPYFISLFSTMGFFILTCNLL